MPGDYVNNLISAIHRLTAEDIDRIMKRPRIKLSVLGLSPLDEAMILLGACGNNEKMKAIFQRRVDQFNRGGLVAMHCLACNTYFYSSAKREGECRCALEPAKT